MATKKEWKDYLKELRIYTKTVAAWIVTEFPKKGTASSMDEEEGEDGDTGSNPPTDPPKPPGT